MTTTETDVAQPRQLYLHQDGGFYRAHGNALHTDDKAPLVIYEHLWPFEPGQLWARPAQEWASRFTAVSEDALRTAQLQNQQLAQRAVTQAKAARRAAALNEKKMPE